MGDYSVKRIYMDVAVLPPIARDYVLAYAKYEKELNKLRQIA